MEEYLSERKMEVDVNRKRPIILLSREMPEIFQNALSDLGQLRIVGNDASAGAMRGGEIYVCAGFDRLNAEMIRRFPPGLGLIANGGNGTDNIALEAAVEKGIAVSNVPLGAEDTADLTMALLLATCRQLNLCENSLRAGKWGLGNNRLTYRVHGKVLGIVGMGAIGRALARRAKGFDMEIHYHGPNRKLEAERALDVVYQPDLQSLLQSADIVSLNCPLTPDTRHLMNSETLAWMKDGSVLINTGRGALIDERALIAEIEAGRLAAVGLDVLEFEPKVNPRLLEFDNVTLLPHVGSATRECREEMAAQLVTNIRQFLRTGTPVNSCL